MGGGIKKSNTCNSSSDFKENSSKLQNMRKNSAPERGASGAGGNGGANGGSGGGNGGGTSYFTKLSFGSTKTAKEKKLLGSPGLHRAIFGKNHHNHGSGDGQPAVIDHEVFSPISFPKVQAPPPMDSGTSNSTPMPIGTGPAQSNSGSSSPSTTVLMPNFGSNLVAVARNSPDYPNMEYPPVFEPETYSLSDPNASLTLLKRRQNHTHHHHQHHHHPHHHHHHQK
uniref:Uncharacterized protein n=1 Tax=Anopheles maculatus TaxID=74869 RepID=A0A182SS29_9DIPT